MERTHLWKSAWGWVGARVEDGALLRRLVLPRPTRREAALRLGVAPGGPAPLPPPPGLAAGLERRLAGEEAGLGFPAAPAGGTPFQRLVWEETARIPWGHTLTYGELARRLGRPGAARAVGLALGANPLPLAVP